MALRVCLLKTYPHPLLPKLLPMSYLARYNLAPAYGNQLAQVCPGLSQCENGKPFIPRALPVSPGHQGWLVTQSCLHLRSHLYHALTYLFSSHQSPSVCLLFLEHTVQNHSHLGPLTLLRPLSLSSTVTLCQKLICLTCHPNSFISLACDTFIT